MQVDKEKYTERERYKGTHTEKDTRINTYIYIHLYIEVDRER